MDVDPSTVADLAGQIRCGQFTSVLTAVRQTTDTAVPLGVSQGALAGIKQRG